VVAIVDETFVRTQSVSETDNNWNCWEKKRRPSRTHLSFAVSSRSPESSSDG